MSTSMRGLLCEGVMIWVPLDFSHSELSNEHMHVLGVYCDDMGTIGILALK